MKLIQSYVPVSCNLEGLQNNYIPKDIIYSHLLSVLYAKKNHRIEFFTNSVIAKQIEKIGFPYDKIDTTVLNKEYSNTFSYYKLKAFESQKEPFVHIDMDTLITKKYFTKYNYGTPALFAHIDQPIPAYKENNLMGIIGHLTQEELETISKTYSGLFYILEKQHNKQKKKNFNIRTIPNMNIVAVFNPQIFTQAVQKSLHHYRINQNIVDQTTFGACYIEQLMIHLNLMETSPEYYNKVKENKHVLSVYPPFDWYSPDCGLYTECFPAHLIIQPIEEIYTGERELSKTEQHMHADLTIKKFFIKDIEALKDFFDFDFYGAVHFSFRKKFPLVECLCIGQIVENFGVHWLDKISEWYKNENLSQGEVMYKKISGYDFKNRKTDYSCGLI